MEEHVDVSMKSGLEGRNNAAIPHDLFDVLQHVSMKSGLEGRNNRALVFVIVFRTSSLNEVRPRRPEQFGMVNEETWYANVSMKSGLEGRNNHT